MDAGSGARTSLGRYLDGLNYAFVGATATQVAAHCIDDICIRWVRISFQQSSSGHELTRLAIAALGSLGCYPCLLQWM